MKANHILKGLEIVASSSGAGALLGFLFFSLNAVSTPPRKRDLFANTLQFLAAAMRRKELKPVSSRRTQEINLQGMHELLQILYRFSLLPAGRRVAIGSMIGGLLGLVAAAIKGSYDSVSAEHTDLKEENAKLRAQLSKEKAIVSQLEATLEEHQKELDQCSAQIEEQARQLAIQKEEKQLVRPATLFRKAASLDSFAGWGSSESNDSLETPSTSNSPQNWQPFLGR